MPNRTNSGTLAAGLCLLATVVFIVMTVALGAVPGAAGAARQHKIELRSTEGLWSRLVSPETARAVAADEQLQHTYLEAVELTADLTRRLADRFAMVPELREASASLEQYRRGLAANTKPLARRANPLESFGELLGLPGASTSGVNMTAAMGGILSTITAPITKAVSGLGDSLINSAGGAALFLGTGLGAGAAQGLNLAPAAKTMQIAAKIAADNGMNATGLNPAIQNAAMGATASLLGSVNISSLGGGASVSSLDIKGIAMSLAMGIGNGTSAGLNLSPQAAALKPPPGNTTADIAGTFGFGLTKSVASNIDLSKVSMGSFNISQLTGSTPLSQFAVSLAAGLGSGAASGLKLTQANLAPPAGNTAPDALGAFGFGLTDSVSSNINTTSLLGSLKNMGGAGGALGNINLAQTASSFATGLGTGAAAGLKLSTNIVGAPDPNGQDVPSIAGNFAFGLTKSVTENFNASKLTSGSGAGGSSALAGLTGSLDIGRVAQGAAMGLLQGAGDAVNSMGGLQALINGTAVMSTQPLPANNMAFNDSVGGAATGFGQGLGGQGTLVGIQLLAQVNVTSLVNGFLNGNPTAAGAAAGAAEAAPASAPAPAMAPAAAPSNGTVVMMRKRAGDHFLPAEIVRRQADAGTINNNNSFNLSALINADTISSVGQRALDALSCEGIGGLILVGLGLVESGTITFGSANKLNATLIKQILPKGVLRFNSGGNTYTIDGTIIANNIDSNLLGAAGGVVVNGNPVISFVAFLVAHSKSCDPAFVFFSSQVISVGVMLTWSPYSPHRHSGLRRLDPLGPEPRCCPQPPRPPQAVSRPPQDPRLDQPHLVLADEPAGHPHPRLRRAGWRHLWSLPDRARRKSSPRRPFHLLPSPPLAPTSLPQGSFLPL